MSQSKKKKDLLIIFTRYPRAGETKTRLIPALGPEKAADLQRIMSEVIFAKCRKLQEKRAIRIDVYYEGRQPGEARRWVPEDMGCFPQKGESLGERLGNAFSDNFSNDIAKIIIIGADCPHITPGILNQGYDILKEKDLVLGPTHDGGYYLIGLKRYAPFPWNKIEWGTEQVLDQTTENARQIGFTWGTLPRLADIDRAEDLQQLTNLGAVFAEFLKN